MIQHDRIGVLFLSANPSDTARLQLDEEAREISQRLARSRNRHRFEFKIAPSLRASDLPYELLDYCPDIVHFSGHGSETGELIFQGENRRTSHPIPPSTLEHLFSRFMDKITCVVLSSCYSEVQALAIAKSIQCVIGMSSAITDSTAIAFSAGFYQALAYGRSISEAFEFGKSEIKLSEHADPQSSSAPRLHVRHGESAKKVWIVSAADIERIQIDSALLEKALRISNESSKEEKFTPLKSTQRDTIVEHQKIHVVDLEKSMHANEFVLTSDTNEFIVNGTPISGNLLASSTPISDKTSPKAPVANKKPTKRGTYFTINGIGVLTLLSLTSIALWVHSSGIGSLFEAILKVFSPGDNLNNPDAIFHATHKIDLGITPNGDHSDLSYNSNKDMFAAVMDSSAPVDSGNSANDLKYESTLGSVKILDIERYTTIIFDNKRQLTQLQSKQPITLPEIDINREHVIKLVNPEFKPWTHTITKSDWERQNSQWIVIIRPIFIRINKPAPAANQPATVVPKDQENYVCKNFPDSPLCIQLPKL